MHEETPMSEDMYVADRDAAHSGRSRSASSGRGTSVPSSVNALSGDEGSDGGISDNAGEVAERRGIGQGWKFRGSDPQDDEGIKVSCKYTRLAAIATHVI